MSRTTLNTTINTKLADHSVITAAELREVHIAQADYGDEQDAAKVDKVAGKSLVSDTEIAKLGTLSAETGASIITKLGFTPVPYARQITINGITLDLSQDRSWTIATNVGSVAWGSLTGTLSGQTDLQNALNAKQASGDYATNTALTTGLGGKADTSHTQAASTITEDATHRFTTDTEKSTWNGKTTNITDTASAALMDSKDAAIIAQTYVASTYATYAAAIAAATGTQKRAVKVTADENNGGVTTYYKYEGSAGVLVPEFDNFSSTYYQTTNGQIEPKDGSITEAKLATAVVTKLNAAGSASINDTTASTSSTYSSTKINSQVSNSKVTGIAITGTTSKTITLTFGDGSTIQANFTDIASNSLTPLSAPVMSTPTVVSSTALTTTWTNVANETNYQLERSTDNATWSTINSPAADVTSYANTGLTASTLYYYRIKAIGNGTVYSDSPYSNVVSATTSAAVTTPATPTTPVTDDTNNTFGWTNSSGYTTPSQYEYTINGGTSYITATANPQTGISDAALAAGQVGVRVKAVGGVNNASGTLFNTVAFTVAASSGTALTSYQTLTGATPDSEGTLFNASGTISGVSTLKFAAGASGWVEMEMPNIAADTGAGNTGYLIVGRTTNQFGVAGQDTTDAAIIIRSVGKVTAYKGGAGTGPTTTVDTASGALSAGGKVRIILDGTTIKFQYSQGGTTWTDITTETQPNLIMYVKVSSQPTDQQRLLRIKTLGVS